MKKTQMSTPFKWMVLVILIGILSITSCEKQLDEPPTANNDLKVETFEDLNNLLNNYGTFSFETHEEVLYCTDNYGLLPELASVYNEAGISGDNVNIRIALHAIWDVDRLPNEIVTAPNLFNEWKIINYANAILTTVNDTNATAEEKEQIIAEASFIRAYSYFRMAQIYTLPYANTNLSEMGLPIKVTSFVEESLVRANLADTWSFMENDLKTAMKLTTQRTTNSSDLTNTFRVTKPAVYAFAARFYMAMHQYETAQTFAEEALNLYSDLIDYNTEMGYSNPNATVLLPQTADINGAFSFVPEFINWKESYYYKRTQAANAQVSETFFPSEDLLNSYDQTYDLRYRFHVVEGYAENIGLDFDYPGYIFFGDQYFLSGPNVPEMLLTKAECQIRRGMWGEGLATANTLRVKRMDVNAPANIIELSATSQEDALMKVLEERRRELPFTTRWDDIRRYNSNETTIDDVTITREFYPIDGIIVLDNQPLQTYTLEKDSRRYARPFPLIEVLLTNGELEQNTY